MDFGDSIRSLASRISQHREAVQTEEATKTAMVLPLIHALGYNVFDPREVTPELTADVGTKKGEKVDYAILKNGKPVVIFECKKAGAELGINQAGQLFRYFSVTESRFGVLTDGIRYLFFTDLDSANKMDEKPFFEFDIMNFDDQDIEELKKFTKEAFDIERIFSTASDLKYLKEIEKVLAVQLNTPSEDFVKVIAGRVYPGKFTQQVRDQFTTLVRRAFSQFVAGRINERLKAAMAGSPDVAGETTQQTDVSEEQTDEIITTSEEFEAFFIVRAILRELVPAKRIVMRDAKSYCAVLFDDNNRKPICRFYFNSPKKLSVGFFDAERNEERVPIRDLDDIYRHVDKLHAVTLAYIKGKAPELAAIS